MSADKELSVREDEARLLRHYTVYYPEGAIEDLDEYDVRSLVGEEAFRAAA